MAVSILWAAAWTAMTLSQFKLAYSLTIFSALWWFGYFILSDKAQHKWDKLSKCAKSYKQKPQNHRKRERYKQASLSYWMSLVLSLAIIAIVTMSLLYWIAVTHEDYDLSLLEGRLYPADEPMPPNACSELAQQLSEEQVGRIARLRQDGLFILAGDNASYATKFPLGVIEVSGKQVFSIDRANDGAVLASLDILSADGKVIVSVQNGRFKINSNNILPSKMRPDKHTLLVMDEFGREALKMRYLNKRTISINALLHYPPEWPEPIVISGAGMKGATIVSGNCSINAGLVRLNAPNMNSADH